MLRISDNIVHCDQELQELQAPTLIRLSSWHISVRKLLLLLLGIFIIFLLLPWTQNVSGEGKVTTLRPEQRPQTIHATIAGRIEHWYVAEGQSVRQGDTIVHLSEVKPEYFDPELVERVNNQVSAKTGAVESYRNKANALDEQMLAMQRELESKQAQIKKKMRQVELKIASDEAALEQARLDVQIARRQFEGVKNLYGKGFKSLTEFEEKKAKMQESEAKLIASENKLASSRNELEIYEAEWQLNRNEYSNKIAKTRGDKFSVLSEKFDALAAVSKLQTDRENYERRRKFYYVLAPQGGYIVKAIKPGIGEILKEGDPVVSILPANYELAVEMFVRPMDLPLISEGRPLRFVFDGWPAFFFSGWPGVSLGTFSGKIVTIDRNISPNGKFRILVAQDSSEAAWPSALRVGGGAKGIALLNNVPLWYELWRVLNGFPPDFYRDGTGSEDDSVDSAKLKAPVKKAK